jgi:acetyltransferase-like isoleucine patch superfamily enzyme
MQILVNGIASLIATLLNKVYGYEGLNLLFRLLPSGQIIYVLRKYGAQIGENVRIQNPFTVHNADKLKPPFLNLSIGNDTYIGRNCFFDLANKITIEDNVTISHFCVINTHTDAGKSPLSKEILKSSSGVVYIQNGAYIGLRVTLLQNVIVGQKSIIGAGSLVKENVQSNSLVAGVPSKFKRLND